MANYAPPIIIHKKKKRTKKELKRARKGRGKTARQVNDLIAEMSAVAGKNKKIVPIVIAYRKPKKKKRSAVLKNSMNNILGQ